VWCELILHWRQDSCSTFHKHCQLFEYCDRIGEGSSEKYCCWWRMFRQPERKASWEWSESVNQSIMLYIITKSMHALWLVNQLWFILSVDPWKIGAFSELLYYYYTRRIRKSLACGSWFTNSSRVPPTSRVVYQPITHSNLWSIA